MFISFHYADLHAKELLVQQAKSNRFDLEFTNYALNEPFDSRWKTQCAERIAQVSTTICLIGENTFYRDAVNWELEKSYELGKQVFGVRIYRYKSHFIPTPLWNRGATILEWNIADIVAELNK